MTGNVHHAARRKWPNLSASQSGDCRLESRTRVSTIAVSATSTLSEAEGTAAASGCAKLPRLHGLHATTRLQSAAIPRNSYPEPFASFPCAWTTCRNHRTTAKAPCSITTPRLHLPLRARARLSQGDARRLRALTRTIEERIGEFGYRVFVDSAPVLEKALAEKAGHRLDRQTHQRHQP